jgi:hypothetical protein
MDIFCVTLSCGCRNEKQILTLINIFTSIKMHLHFQVGVGDVVEGVVIFTATFNNILAMPWMSVLFVEEPRIISQTCFKSPTNIIT